MPSSTSPPAAATPVLDGFRALAPWPGATPVFLACSGGADSTYLAWAWKCFAAELENPPAVTAVVIDHGQRPSSEGEAQQAATALSELGFNVVVRSAELQTDASENEMRQARYRELLKLAEVGGTSAVVLTAHHADDVAETVLLRIMRGTGLRGLAGIPVRRQLSPQVELCRPLLQLRRKRLRQDLQAAGIEWIEDPSNADSQVAARNRLRHEVLPALATIATGDPIAAVLRLTAEAEEWQQAQKELIQANTDWRSLPTFLRQQAIAHELRVLGETVSPARLCDLEGALLKHGTAGVDAIRNLVLRDHRLKVE